MTASCRTGEAAGAFDHVIVGDDMAGGIPDEAGARLRAAVLAFGLRGVERAGAGAHDLDDRWRCALEQFDRRAFDVGERAARLDRARGRGRKQQAIEIGLRDVDAHDEQQRCNHDPRQSIAHRRLHTRRCYERLNEL